jgi:RNase P protein component
MLVSIVVVVGEAVKRGRTWRQVKAVLRVLLAVDFE